MSEAEMNHHADPTGSEPPQQPAFDPRDPRTLAMAPTPAGGMQRYREMTIDELLLENRIIFLVGEINHGTATAIIMRMLYLANQRKDQDINLYINSHGGAVDDTLAIYDTMQYLPCDVATYCIGRAMSGGAMVLASGAKGKRHALPHAKVMLHQPYGGVSGQTSDVEIQAEEILKSKKVLNDLIAKHTGQSVDKVSEDSERDKYFSAAEAAEYGLVDEVLDEADEKKAGGGSSGSSGSSGASSADSDSGPGSSPKKKK